MTVVNMVSLDKHLTKSRVKPTSIRMFSIQDVNAPRISYMHLLAGGSWLFTANAEELMCWDLASPDNIRHVSISGKDQGYKDICVRNLQAQLHGDGNEAVVAAYMSYDGHQSNVRNDKVAIWQITGLSHEGQLLSSFVTLLCFPDYATEYGMSDLSGDYVAFLGREHETPVISVTNWRTESENENSQAKFRPDFSVIIPEAESLRVQGIKLVPPYVAVVAGPVIALFLIPPFERVKHLCGDAPRLRATYIHRFDSRAYALMGEFIGFSQNAAVVRDTVTPQSITLLMSRARVAVVPTSLDVKTESEITYIMPPTVSRLRQWAYWTSKPAIIGPTARDKDPEEERDVQPEAHEGQASTSEHTTRDSRAAEVSVTTHWPRDGVPDETVMQGWNALPRGRARKVDMYPVKVEEVKRIAFDEGTGRTCLGMRNGEVHVLDFT
ncbi:hypothetical protein BU17DRAFT_70251 [Hysterangium stoloniferum]|nr:hypothetical protein BU17DRAFT_70251 [Hysterangium stoloniferum]